MALIKDTHRLGIQPVFNSHWPTGFSVADTGKNGKQQLAAITDKEKKFIPTFSDTTLKALGLPVGTGIAATLFYILFRLVFKH